MSSAAPSGSIAGRRTPVRAGKAAPSPPPRAPAADGKSDCELVAGLYADTFDRAFGAAETLSFNNCGWGDREAAQLAKALLRARRLTWLSIEGNTSSGGYMGIGAGGIGARGYGALADAIRAGAAPRLQTLHFDIPSTAGHPIHDNASTLLRKACEARGIKALLPISPLV